MVNDNTRTDLRAEVRLFEQCESYTQHEPGLASFRWILKQGEIPEVCMGLVSLEGPIHKTPGVHQEWDQVYLVFSGTGMVHLDNRSERIASPSAVIIPAGTRHSIELQRGEKIEYVYVNKWR